MPTKSLKIRPINENSKKEVIALASYACHRGESRGRLHKEPEDPTRSVFQRDCDRIVHSTAFRRLEYKTQVFVYHEGDHFRTRLTHSLEVSQLARSVARELFLNEYLAETIALAHDFGHTPFGHAGEDALDEAMSEFGGFDHNAQTIRIVTKLESKYADFDGLNLTWECLEGLAKHNGPVKNPPRALKEYNDQHDLELNTHASIEAQISALCDDIAYNNHDIEDGIRAHLFTVDDMMDLPLIGEALTNVRKKYRDLEEPRLIHEAKRKLINRMVKDIVAETKKNIEEAKIETVDDVRNFNRAIVAFSPEMEKDVKVLQEFLFNNMYKHYKVNRMVTKSAKVLKDLFEFFMDKPSCLPTSWRKQAENSNLQEKAVIVADFIAGMTDRFAFEEHRKIFDLTNKLIGD